MESGGGKKGFSKQFSWSNFFGGIFELGNWPQLLLLSHLPPGASEKQ